MRDGIYKVDFQSEKDAAKGIAMVTSQGLTKHMFISAKSKAREGNSALS